MLSLRVHRQRHTQEEITSEPSLCLGELRTKSQGPGLHSALQRFPSLVFPYLQIIQLLIGCLRSCCNMDTHLKSVSSSEQNNVRRSNWGNLSLQISFSSHWQSMPLVSIYILSSTSKAYVADCLALYYNSLYRVCCLKTSTESCKTFIL